jgi:hypothetical protein
MFLDLYCISLGGFSSFNQELTATDSFDITLCNLGSQTHTYILARPFT